ncbi:Phosphoglucan [Forsythia ovata]|uniref:Phosphoglucan n=1 Tax=Forsythia ovata TaxID=205694 RepID=A0ABD1U4Z1_9LAMI
MSAILGSAKELGSWKKKVMMNWTEKGWVCDLELKSNKEPIEYKFVIVGKDKKNLKWESGDNRVLKLPQRGSFNMVCKWNVTNEPVEILPSDDQVESEESQNGNFTLASNEAVTVSDFVGQWQGNDVSFVRSKDQLDAQKKSSWVTLGLEGLALKLVERDQSARNWWRKLEVVRELVVESVESRETFGGSYIFSYISEVDKHRANSLL